MYNKSSTDKVDRNSSRDNVHELMLLHINIINNVLEIISVSLNIVTLVLIRKVETRYKFTL